jgi:hypothetical protein
MKIFEKLAKNNFLTPPFFYVFPPLKKNEFSMIWEEPATIDLRPVLVSNSLPLEGGIQLQKIPNEKLVILKSCSDAKFDFFLLLVTY